MDNELRQLWFFDYVKDPDNERYLFAVVGWFNGLVRIDIETGEAKIVGRIPDEEMESFFLSFKIILVERNIYIIPYNAKNISVFNLDDYSMNLVDISNEIGFFIDSKYKFTGAFSFPQNKKLYVLPGSVTCLLSVDINTLKLMSYKLGDNISKKGKNELVIKGRGFQFKNKIYMLEASGSRWISFDVITDEFECRDIQGDVEIIAYAFDQRRSLIELDANGKLIEINMDSQQQVVLGTIDATSVKRNNPPVIAITQRIIMVMFQETDKILLFNRDNGAISKQSILIQENHSNSLWNPWKTRWLFSCEQDNKIVAFNSLGNMLITFNQIGDIISEKNIYLKDKLNIFDPYRFSGTTEEESKYYPYNHIDNLLELLSKDKENERERLLKTNIGHKIYEIIR